MASQNTTGMYVLLFHVRKVLHSGILLYSIILHLCNKNNALYIVYNKNTALLQHQLSLIYGGRKLDRARGTYVSNMKSEVSFLYIFKAEGVLRALDVL